MRCWVSRSNGWWRSIVRRDRESSDVREVDLHFMAVHTFIAVEIGADIAHAVALQESSPDRRMKWVEPENLHASLHFWAKSTIASCIRSAAR